MTRYDRDRIVVFSGPTLFGRSLRPPFESHPPAAAGDLLRLMRDRPCTTLLIDGVFDERPSVWHKEVLMLLASGYRVIGAASMGALRAAELRTFGMIGVGRIYQAYATGRITGDDEVALAHGSAHYGFKPVSLPHINVRATLEWACRVRLIPVCTARAIRDLSAVMPYPDRIWSTVIAEARASGIEIPPEFHDALPHIERDLKAQDAQDALDLALNLRSDPPPAFALPPLTPFLEDVARAVGVCLPLPDHG